MQDEETRGEVASGKQDRGAAAVGHKPTVILVDTRRPVGMIQKVSDFGMVLLQGDPMDPILRRLNAIQWVYSNGDPATVAELAQRIADIGRTPTGFLTYSELVDGVTFTLPNVNDGRPFEIMEWTNLERAITGCFLGNIAAESYRQGRFFASALVIGFVANQPGEGFWSLAQEVGLLRSNDEDARLRLWFEHERLARKGYTARPGLQ